MTALPNYPSVHAITARRAKIAPGNSIFAPLAKDPERKRELAEAEGAPMAVDVPCLVNLDPPPQWAERRRQMRRDGLQLIACAVLFLALIGFAIKPDASVVQAQMEDAQ